MNIFHKIETATEQELDAIIEQYLGDDVDVVDDAIMDAIEDAVKKFQPSLFETNPPSPALLASLS